MMGLFSYQGGGLISPPADESLIKRLGWASLFMGRKRAVSSDPKTGAATPAQSAQPWGEEKRRERARTLLPVYLLNRSTSFFLSSSGPHVPHVSEGPSSISFP